MPRAAKARVLAVDDNPIVRADLRLILGEAGFDVCADTGDGIEAVRLARRERPDLVLIDLNLPGIDGVEATRRILKDQMVPVVALTGYRNGDLVERAMSAGAVAHVLKPYHETPLVATIREALASFGTTKRHAVLALDEADHWRKLALVEDMVRKNYSEREISEALRRGYM